jgi:DNA-binding response OmpR family regulator
MSLSRNEDNTILVVDDHPDNLRLLAGILNEHHYKVRLAPNGDRAVATIRKEAPGRILLDIMMPVMDGFEVCRQLKADKQTAGIPIIFISAVNETVDKVKAFALGGVDYITKPFRSEVVLARVKTHLSLRSPQLQMEKKMPNCRWPWMKSRFCGGLSPFVRPAKRFEMIKAIGSRSSITSANTRKPNFPMAAVTNAPRSYIRISYMAIDRLRLRQGKDNLADMFAAFHQPMRCGRIL